MIHLRPYQETMLAEARAMMNNGCRSLILQAPTGSGKTILTAKMVSAAQANGFSVWFIVHRRELVKQSQNAFAAVGVPHGTISAGFETCLQQPVQICSIGTLSRRHQSLRKPKLIIWDECFVAGTLIDGQRIESIIAGDIVKSFCDKTGEIKYRMVMNVFKRKAPNRLLTIHFGSGSVTCTGSHPFFTMRGWVLARDLVVEDELFESVYGLRDQNRQGPETVLEMLPIGDGSKKQNRGARAYAQQKSNEAGIGSKKSESVSKKNRTQAKATGRQWSWAYALADSLISSYRWLANGVRCPNWSKSAWHSNTLQNRHCEPGTDDSYRGGRPISWVAGATGAGSKKTEVVRIARVDCIEIHEQANRAEFRRVCPDGFVYNLEVDETHTYFANGIAVHNCHHIGAKSWAELRAAHPQAFHIGLSATPERLDGKGLGHYFSAMVRGPSVQDLISAGYLSSYRLFAPPTVSLDGVHMRAGDFIRSELGEKIDKPKITGDAIDHYIRHARGKRAVVFAVSVEHSKNVVAQFMAAGISAVHIDGGCDARTRDEAIRMFETGEVSVLSNVELLGEGFDMQAIEVGILLRPTQSLGLFLQQCGRVLRPAAGKQQAIILDHAGNTERHGFPCDDRDWSLEDRIRRPGNKDSGPNVRVCPKCFLAIKAGPPVCPYCQTTFKIKPRRVGSADGELAETDPEKARAARVKNRQEQRHYHTEAELIELGKQRGYRRPHLWARHVLRGRKVKA